LTRLRSDLKLPGTLQAAGIAPRDLWENMDKIVKATLDDPCCQTNPLKVEDFMVRRILEEVMGRV
jgi:alcohol dehydrogenase class IV